ncbi:MAG: hypothetical protein JNJ71_01310 [Rubrivivax sp.]|nr:hypothetical protein [Rubrivivax sp.]
MINPSPADETADAAKPAAPVLRHWPWLLSAASWAGAGVLAWQGGLPALLGCAGAVLGTAVPGLVQRRRLGQSTDTPAATVDATAAAVAPGSDSTRAPGTAPPDRQPGHGSTAVAADSSSPMVTHVIPVWARQLDATRGSADAGLANVLNAFSEMNGALDTLLSNLQGMSTSAQPGAVDQAVQASAGPLGALLAPSQRAFDLHDKALSELRHCAQALQEITPLARQAQEIGRHTRLVAFNASIEASRDNTRDGGNEAVAHEMRLLATRMSDNAIAMQRIVTPLLQRLNQMLHQAATQDVAPEELRMEVELRAREALQTLMSSVGASLSTSGSVRDASAAMRQHLEDAFVHFQFGDRVSQMLAIIGNDMNHFVDWVSRHPAATVDDATEWLRRLESSYTMEEQRSEHHGNVHVDRGSEVEFF